MLTPTDLPLAELSGARLDGELFLLAGAWCPVDTPDAPETRASALARIAPRRAAAERMTAAWIYGLAPEPAQHQFCVDTGARTSKPDDHAMHLREVRLPRNDTRVFGRLPVTTALRTAVDLARWGASAGCRADTALIARLLARAGFDGTERAGDILSGTTRPISFSQVAATQLQDALRRLLPVADPVDVVDGVDAPHGVQHPVQVRGVAHLEDEPADGQSVA